VREANRAVETARDDRATVAAEGDGPARRIVSQDRRRDGIQTLAEPSSLEVITLLPSGEKLTLLTAESLWPSSGAERAKVGLPHQRWPEPSIDDVAIVLPSDEKATPFTWFECAARTVVRFPVSARQTRTLLSELEVATRSPRGLQARSITSEP
jgi:hypothetical protein